MIWDASRNPEAYQFSSHYFNITAGSTTASSSSVSSTASATKTAVASGAGTATSSSSIPPSQNSQNGGLSLGAKIGIGVGVGVGVGCLLIGIAIGFFLRRRSRKPKAANEKANSSHSQGPLKVGQQGGVHREYYGGAAPTYSEAQKDMPAYQELPQTYPGYQPARELSGEEAVHEVQGSQQTIAELPPK